MTASLSMLSDSFHMLSDVIALIVALVAVRFAEKSHSTKKNTFGWIRAEVMGALVNAVFLTALCFTILLEAIERFTEPHEIESPEVVAGVGAAGLLVNLLGLCLFHGHAGGGHGHSHGGKNKKLKMGKAGKGSPAAETSTLVDNHNSPSDTKPKNGKTRFGVLNGLFLLVLVLMSSYSHSLTPDLLLWSPKNCSESVLTSCWRVRVVPVIPLSHEQKLHILVFPDRIMV